MTDEGASAGVPEVTEDSLLGGRLRLRQPAEGYRTAIDPVFLAASVPAGEGDSVLDLGCGVGAAALCLLARVRGLRVTGLELQAELVRLAGANAELNRVANRFVPILGDIAKPPPRLAPGAFHHVMCNPPYLPAEGARPAADPARDAAMRETTAALADWVTIALAMARAKGSVTFVHRADRIDALLAALHGRAGEIVVCPLWPGGDGEKAAKRVIVRARKGVASPSRLVTGLTLHAPDGGFTPAADAILRDAAPLTL